MNRRDWLRAAASAGLGLRRAASPLAGALLASGAVETPAEARGLGGDQSAAAPSTTPNRTKAGSAPPYAYVDLETREIKVGGDRALGTRFTLSWPKHVPLNTPLPLLVLLHGLAETVDESVGIRAWLDRYGLGEAVDRLRRPPVVRTSKRKDFSDERLAAVNADLMQLPFEGFAVACPYTPKITRAPELDAYARWVVEKVIPRARSERALLAGPTFTALDGCSLGGFVGFEIMTRYPDAFGAWGGVQSAISEGAAPVYAERLARALAPGSAGRPPKPLHLLTSADDVFRKGNERFAAELTQRGIDFACAPNELLVIPGWHDQAWIREAGAIEMLLWHQRRFRIAGASATITPLR